MLKVKEELKLAAQALKAGKIILIPTETVLGLAVVYDNYQAYESLVNLKRRPKEKVFPLVVNSYVLIEEICDLNLLQKKAVKALLPGPITLILPLKKTLPPYLGKAGSIAIRYSTDEKLNALISLVKKPLLLTSANLSGGATFNSVEEAMQVFQNKVAVYVSGKPSYGLASSVVDFTTPDPKMLRLGPVSLEEIERKLK